MICIEVRRNLLTDPANSQAEILSHIEECAACAMFKQSVQDLDQHLNDTLNMPVPDELPARILLKHHHTNRQQRIKRRILGFSLAATLLVFVGTFASLGLLAPSASLGEIAIAHINSELEHLEAKENVDLAKINTILAASRLKVNQSIGKVNFIGKCSLDNKSVVHIVLEGKAGPVTLLLFQGKRIGAKQSIGNQRFKGTIVPAIRGNIAIVGEQGEVINEIEKRILPLLQSV